MILSKCTLRCSSIRSSSSVKQLFTQLVAQCAPQLERRPRLHSGVGIIGAPFAKGQSKAGTDKGPAALRDGGLSGELQRLGWNVKDYGDLMLDTTTSNDEFQIENLELPSTTTTSDIKKHNVQHISSVANAVENLSEAVAAVIQDGRLPITLGGDHSLGIGSIFGHSRVVNELCVIWVDAHADINTLHTSKTGHMHGMPVSFLIKEVSNGISRPAEILKYFHHIKPCVSARNFAYIGLRDLDDAETNILRQLEPQLTVYSIRDVDQLGIFEVTNRVLDRINPALKLPIHVSFDIDAVDEYFAPSTGTSVPGGLTIREAFCIGEQIAKTKRLSALDLVEVNPLIGSSHDVNRTVNCAINILLSFLGRNRLSLYARHPSKQFYGVQ